MKHSEAKPRSLYTTILALVFLSLAANVTGQENSREIEFPDIPGYRTLKCDLHMHTVFSDGSVWPNIRVQEALKDGLDVISITDHLEYQPKVEDVPHVDRNRGYQLAKAAAEGKDLIVINGAEITRGMPPGHANAIFIEDANKLNVKSFEEAYKEAKNQGAFVFWNHPHWTAQQKNGVATLSDLHQKLIGAGLIQGIEIYNESTYSDEALQIALDHNLTIIGTSDIHGLVDWQFNIQEGGHRPVTLAFAREKTEDELKKAIEQRRTAVWFDNTLVGNQEFLSPLIEASLKVSRLGQSPVQTLMIENKSDADFILQNLSEYTLHNKASVFILKAHETTRLEVKTIETISPISLRFRVLNAFTAPREHPEIAISVE
jgi:predicted metal-dependent phosphoesterase TrpH